MNVETCKSRTKTGQRCRAKATATGYCSLHSDPGRAAELGRKSGQARRYVLPQDQPVVEMKPPRNAKDVRDVVGQAMSDVRARRLDPKVASVLGYLAGVLLKSIEVADVESRVSALETILKAGPVETKQQGR